KEKRRREEEQARQQARERAAREAAGQAERERQAAARAAREAAEREREKARLERRKAERERARAERERKRAEVERQKAERDAQARAARRRDAAAGAALGKVLDEVTQSPAQQTSRAKSPRKSAPKRQATSKAARREPAQRSALEEQAIQRGAAELARPGSARTAPGSVRTRLDVPQRDRTGGGTGSAARARRRQAGEPNFYALKAFRVTDEIRQRPAQARRTQRTAVTILLVALLGIAGLVLTAQYWQPPAQVKGAEAIAVDAGGDLYLLAANRLLHHDRAGVAVTTIDSDALGAHVPGPPLAFVADGALLASGSAAAGQVAAEDSGTATLVRCELAAAGCTPLPSLPAGTRVSDFRPQPIDGSIFIADRNAGALLQVTAEGEVIARAPLQFAANPVLNLDSGLLLTNSREGAAISVYRYDRQAFGQQLDEILLLPAAKGAAEHTAVADFLDAGGSWWVVMYNPRSRDAGIYRFDSQWNYIDTIEAPARRLPLDLVKWGDRVLVNTGSDLSLARYNLQGAPEAPFSSTLLTELATRHEQQARIGGLALRGGLVAASLLAVLALGLAYLSRLRRLVYRLQRERGAQPIDEFTDSLEWVPHRPDRASALGRRIAACAVLLIAACLLAVGVGASTSQLAALLLFGAGPLSALVILQRKSPGHIGATDEQLLLVDHKDLYHFGAGAEIQYRGNFLLLYDVVVHCGSRLSPGFTVSSLNTHVAPLVRGGVRVDRATVVVKLLQSRHPLAMAVIALVLCASAAAFALATPLLF
ncbi:MAG: hypothetical protein R3228_14200, partial [Halioglobus sp.]|nr:hypothetical protein [Halioglobus sp.]